MLAAGQSFEVPATAAAPLLRPASPKRSAFRSGPPTRRPSARPERRAQCQPARAGLDARPGSRGGPGCCATAAIPAARRPAPRRAQPSAGRPAGPETAPPPAPEKQLVTAIHRPESWPLGRYAQLLDGGPMTTAPFPSHLPRRSPSGCRDPGQARTCFPRTAHRRLERQMRQVQRQVFPGASRRKPPAVRTNRRRPNLRSARSTRGWDALDASWPTSSASRRRAAIG